MQDIESGLSLVDCDEFLGALWKKSQSSGRFCLQGWELRRPTLSTFSGLICGGGGIFATDTASLGEVEMVEKTISRDCAVVCPRDDSQMPC